MKLKEILSDSVRYPLSNPKRLLILGILLFFSILIIPAILAYGYELRIMRYSFKGSEELPPFNEWLNMFVDGLKYIIVNIIYIGIPALITSFIVIFILMGMLIGTQTPDFNTFMGTFLLVFLTVAIIIMTVPFLFSQVALPHIVKNDKLDVLLEIKNLLNIIRGMGWGKFLAAMILLVAFSSLLSGLSFIPQYLQLGQLTIYAFSAVLSLVIGSYLLAFRGRLLALLYEDGVEASED